MKDATRLEGASSTDGFPGGIFSSVDFEGVGQGGNIQIDTGSLDISNGSQVSAATFGFGDAGNIVISVKDATRLEGASSTDGFPGGISSRVELSGKGQGGDIQIDTGSLDISNGSQVSAATFGFGDAGNIIISTQEATLLEGINSTGRFPGGIFSSVDFEGVGQGGNVRIDTDSLYLLANSQISAATFGNGDAGVVEILSNDFHVEDGGLLSASSASETGSAGGIGVYLNNLLQSRNGDIAADSQYTNSGQIQIDASTIILYGDSDIRTFSSEGQDEGGSIVVATNILIAFDDSDIVAVTSDGRGGNLTLRRQNDSKESTVLPDIFSETLDPFSLNDFSEADNNGQVNFIATGTLSGVGETISLINDLSELSDTFIDSEILVSASCITRSTGSEGNVTLTGRDRLPQTPNETTSTTYPVGTVQPIPTAQETTSITEPQSMYRLADGRLLMSRDCQQ